VPVAGKAGFSAKGGAEKGQKSYFTKRKGIAMTLQQCYENLGGNYQEVSSRLPSEKFIQKFVLKFLDDKTIELLQSSWEAENYEEAFRAAHTIKGMCQNLSFSLLQESSSQLTEALRGGVTPEAKELYPKVLADFEKTASAIKAYKEGL
jgi:HPt (histidine-containing phosphotransfer) domain-containing protein